MLRIATLAILLVSSLACSTQNHHKLSDPASAPPRNSATQEQQKPQAVFEPPGRAPVLVNLEVADTEPKRNMGLMFRKHLDPNNGMIFIYDRPQDLIFWMRNTYIPLDMIFLGPDLRVVGVIENTTPLTDTPRSIGAPSQYCVEVNAGFARQNSIGPGTRVRLVGLDS